VDLVERQHRDRRGFRLRSGSRYRQRGDRGERRRACSAPCGSKPPGPPARARGDPGPARGLKARRGFLHSSSLLFLSLRADLTDSTM
jgi:hypothetical protein